MDSNKNAETNLEKTVGAVTELVKAVPIYQDAVQPAAKEIGAALGTVAKVVNVALAPISAFIWGYDKIKEFIETKVSEKLKNVPTENIITPPINIAGPAIEAMRFTAEDEQLRELYANLLASSMDKATTSKAHPRYVEVIKNITSDEAILLQAFLLQDAYPKLEIREKHSPDSYLTITPTFTTFQRNYSLKNENNIGIYLNNLCQLGILEIPYGLYITNNDFYTKLETDMEIVKMKENAANYNRSIELKQGVIRLTSFGENFINNVVRSK